MTSESATVATAQTAETASAATTQPAVATVDHNNQPPSKIDPITAVQDSIDSLALSLFEALRGVRDAVAPESLEVPGARPPNAAGGDAPVVPTTAFAEPNEEIETDKLSAKERLLNGLNLEYFPPRAFDLLEPEYESFLLAYLSDNPYAKELVERFAELDSASKKAAEDTSKQQQSVDNAKQESPTKKNAEDNNVKLGDVGYEFRKKFDSGWYTGKVTEIKALAENGYDRRCVYTDGDIEDLRLEDLQELAKLDPNYQKPKPKLSINIKAAKATSPPKSTGSPSKKSYSVKFPLTQKEYTKLLLDTEHERDVQTTTALAQDILAKSAEVNDLVANLPGMHRTRDEQMERINELIQQNHEVTRELEEAYVIAQKRREEVRVALGESTCLALRVEEDT